ncbi:MAG: hypothetical protein ACRCW1_10085 [Anaerotignaceae bacterium]
MKIEGTPEEILNFLELFESKRDVKKHLVEEMENGKKVCFLLLLRRGCWIGI